MREHALKLLVVVALVGVAVALRRREAALPATPEDAIGAFFDAAKAGDERAYLRLTTGPMRKVLETTRSELGAKRFKQNLIASAAGIKGHAIIPGEPAQDGVARLTVEVVFVDRKEVQRVRLRKVGAGWAIEEMSEARVVKPPIPYGTPVFKIPPLGQKTAP